MNLTPNFTLRELRGEAAPPKVRQNLQKTTNGLQAFRDILGVPFRVTSCYRSPDRNDEVGGYPLRTGGVPATDSPGPLQLPAEADGERILAHLTLLPELHPRGSRIQLSVEFTGCSGHRCCIPKPRKWPKIVRNSQRNSQRSFEPAVGFYKRGIDRVTRATEKDMKQFLLASDFDETLSFNDSGLV
jgi:hypothetical protein